MTLNDAYLVSQIAAAVMVVPTLLYLSLQVRQNTAQLKAAARYQFVDATGQMNVVIAQSSQAASVFRRGNEAFESLDENERIQFVFFIAQHFQIHSVMFELYQDGLLPETQWYNVRKDILAMVQTPGGQRVWENFAKTALEPKYVAFVERLVAGAEPSYSVTSLGQTI